MCKQLLKESSEIFGSFNFKKSVRILIAGKIGYRLWINNRFRGFTVSRFHGCFAELGASVCS